MSDITPTDPTDEALKAAESSTVIKSEGPKEGTDSHVAGHDEQD